MKIIALLSFFVGLVQATEVDWNDVRPLDIEPVHLKPLLEERARLLESPERITAGEEAYIGQFPHQVGLFVDTEQGIFFCGGSIISEDWILTAAHCVDHALSVTIVIGGHNVQNPEPNQIRISASKIIWHEQWDATNVKQDVGLLKTSRKIDFNSRVQPIRLARRDQVANTFAGVEGIVSGWGRTENSGNSGSPTLQWTSNPITTNAVCNIWYFSSISSNQICLSATGGRSACQGDSGGPLVITDTDGFPTQVGVVSHVFILGCQSGWPSVYSRVTSFLDWIAENTDLDV